MEINQMLKRQEHFFQSQKTKKYEFRKKALLRLECAIKQHEEDMEHALYKDLGKSSFESYMAEIGMVKSELSYAKKHLKKWMKTDQVKTPLAEDEQVQPADSVQKVAQEMRRGHDRIAAMRAKVAAGHEADRAAVYRKVFGGNDNIEAIRRLRSSKTISSGVVRPTAIRADLLEGKLREFQAQP